MIPNCLDFFSCASRKQDEDDYEIVCIKKGKIKIELPSDVNGQTLMIMITALLEKNAFFY